MALREGLPSLWLGTVDFVLATLVLVALLRQRDCAAGRVRVAAVFAAAAGVAVALYVWQPAFLIYLPCLFINGALAWLFQGSLQAGREPLITRFARIERGGQMPAVLERYTRRLTWAWTLFFYGLLLESLLLAQRASAETYLLFANTVNYLLVAGFFLVEYLYRRIRYRQFPHSSPRAFLRMLIRTRVIGGDRH